jgi:predicted fused transcriptional regulator/phosphomethylpyrimidine kinase
MREYVLRRQETERRTRTMEGYCVKEKMKREIVDPKEVVLKNGRHAVQGTCAVCGTKMTRFVKKSS